MPNDDPYVCTIKVVIAVKGLLLVEVLADDVQVASSPILIQV
eukprot:CAMPEP_0113725614 /NCGR_PEP_ID=MMETSP0038_2-20120614/39876_1 /TAXON_ID=2898 /ORGANISM="Cryptomonas paramecium" /LENGTH=41 /DNA_ID=CAMNT_0000655933 /DNA_START=104 /DNA_END=225 /DNA_ORIENTATION=- /assembly_acc=CAM_ASM_000170